MARLDLIKNLDNSVPSGIAESALGCVGRGYAHLDRAKLAKEEKQKLSEYRDVIDSWNRAIAIGLHTVPEIMKSVDPDIHYLLSVKLMESSGNLQQTITDLTHTIKSDSTHTQSYIKRAEIYEELSIYRKAIEDLTTAIEISPEIVISYEARSRNHLKLRQYRAASTDLAVAIEKRPEKVSNYYNRANAYRLQSKLDLARLDYLKVVELSPQSSLSKLAKIRIKEIPETPVPKKEKSSKWNWFQKSQES
jgi:tetratricopeptide (TPR) repeat protein